MNGIYFELNPWAALIYFFIACGAYFLWSRASSSPEPFLYFSNLRSLKSRSPGWRIRLASLPQWLERAACTLFLLALIDPHLQIAKDTRPSGRQIPTEGIAIYLVLDQSGSMNEKVVATIGGQLEAIPKIDLLKQLTAKFVGGDADIGLKGRSNDLIGLITFSRTAHVLSPLTFDHSTILQDLSKLEVVTQKDQDGTAIGYAIFKTANLIAATRYYSQEASKKSPYDIKNSLILLVTDGLQEVNPLDEDNPLRTMSVQEATDYAKEKSVRVYIVNIEPAFSTEEFAPHRRVMQQAAEKTGGKFYLMEAAGNLDQIYADIDKIEKSALPELGKSLSKDEQPNLYRRISFYPYLIALGMFFLLTSILLNTTLLRRVP